MSVTFGKLSDFINKLEKNKLDCDDYGIIYAKEKNIYGYIKKSELNSFSYNNGYLNIVGILRNNVITNEIYFTRWEDMSISEQEVLFDIVIKLKNREKLLEE